MSDQGPDTARAYENGEIRVLWRPELCAHSGVCSPHTKMLLRLSGGDGFGLKFSPEYYTRRPERPQLDQIAGTLASLIG